ncbi:MAG: DUF3696 domain-containing protein [Nitrospirae bacterium]|nr:DUF3696 domain-containing protein [Nitrospirota bacterium]
MIEYVKLERFKCFYDETIPLAPLTILAGANNTGKSTVIQALLLLKQTAQIHEYTEVVEHRINSNRVMSRMPITTKNMNWTISLNGPLIQMGTAHDVFCQWSESDNIKVSLVFRKYPENIMTLKLLYDSSILDTHNMKAEISFDFASFQEDLHNMRFTYIGAMRTGPLLIYPASDEQIQNMSVGNMGQFTVHCLYQFGQEMSVINRLAYDEKEVKSMTLSHQTEKWMNYLIPGIAFTYNKIKEADAFTVGIRNVNRDTGFFKPTHVGVGITYCLPIVVAALMSKVGNVLICENPESHLHPEAQSRMGLFLARVADAGIQVILETHSDHILNGIRVAVKRGVIKYSNVAINSFNRDHVVSHPKIDKNGRIDLWPEGFFDQIDIDLGELI